MLNKKTKELYRRAVMRLTPGQIDAAKRMGKSNGYSFEMALLKSAYWNVKGSIHELPEPKEEWVAEVISDIDFEQGMRGFDIHREATWIKDRIVGFASAEEVEKVKEILSFNLEEGE